MHMYNRILHTCKHVHVHTAELGHHKIRPPQCVQNTLRPMVSYIQYTERVTYACQNHINLYVNVHLHVRVGVKYIAIVINCI